MRKLLFAVCLAVILIVAARTPASSVDGRSGGSSSGEVEKVLADQVAAWNRGRRQPA